MPREKRTLFVFNGEYRDTVCLCEDGKELRTGIGSRNHTPAQAAAVFIDHVGAQLPAAAEAEGLRREIDNLSGLVTAHGAGRDKAEREAERLSESLYTERNQAAELRTVMGLDADASHADMVATAARHREQVSDLAAGLDAGNKRWQEARGEAERLLDAARERIGRALKLAAPPPTVALICDMIAAQRDTTASREATIKRLRTEVQEGNAKVAARDATITKSRADAAHWHKLFDVASGERASQIGAMGAQIASLEADLATTRDIYAVASRQRDEQQEIAASLRADLAKVVEACPSAHALRVWRCAVDGDMPNLAAALGRLADARDALAAYEAGKPADLVAEEPEVKCLCGNPITRHGPPADCSTCHDALCDACCERHADEACVIEEAKPE